MPHFDNAPAEMNALMEKVYAECKAKGESDEVAAQKAIAAAKQAGYEEKDGKWSKHMEMSTESISLITEAVQLSGPETKRKLKGIMLSVGEKHAKTGTIKFEKDFFQAADLQGFVGKLVTLGHTSDHHGNPLAAVARISNVRRSNDGNGAIFEAEFGESQVAQDAAKTVSDFGGAVSIEAEMTIGPGRKVQPTGYTPKAVALLLPGHQSDPNAKVEVAMARSELSLIEVEAQQEDNPMDEKDKQEFERVKMELAKATEELTKVKAERDTFAKERAEAERKSLLAEVVELSKQLDQKEPEATASSDVLSKAKGGLIEMAARKHLEELAKAKAAPKGAGLQPQNGSAQKTKPTDEGAFLTITLPKRN